MIQVPAPQSLTVKVEPAGQGEKVTAEFVNADGTRATTVYTANFDGKDSPLTGSQIDNTVALTRVDARTTVRTDKKDGKVVQTLTRVVASDGKTMTVTGKGTNAQGQAVNNVIVFDKQESHRLVENAGPWRCTGPHGCRECPPGAPGLATLAMRKAGAGMLAVSHAW
jgi:hypothetical protein